MQYKYQQGLFFKQKLENSDLLHYWKYNKQKKHRGENIIRNVNPNK